METLTSLDKFKSYLAGLGGNAIEKDPYYFVCIQGPLQPPTRIPWTQTDVIKEHKATCHWCLEGEKERQQQHERELDTERRIQGCGLLISKAKLDIACYEDRKKAAEEKRARGEELDAIEQEKLRLALYDAGVAEAIIKREIQEMERLKKKKEE